MQIVCSSGIIKNDIKLRNQNYTAKVRFSANVDDNLRIKCDLFDHQETIKEISNQEMQKSSKVRFSAKSGRQS